MSNQVTTAPRAEIWAEIATKHAELQALYAEAGLNILKKTAGKAFLGEKNTPHAQYWYDKVKKHPSLVKGTFNSSDYGVKSELFPFFVDAYNGHNAAGAILDLPYDIISTDLRNYASEAREAFTDSGDAVHKQIVKDAPQFRKPQVNNSNSKGDKTAADKSTDNSKLE